ncbi:MAG: hypothetical protein RJA80_364, partial [Actinomycetota bacterium]
MQALLWLLIPVFVGLVTTIYLAIKYRPSRPANAHKGMSGLLEFRKAMDRPLP